MSVVLVYIIQFVVLFFFFFIFFFFKQKTAYEMRISDWSSDVCSSDLDIAFRLHREGAAVTVADINPEMLGVGMERAKKRGLEGLVWAEENAESLSFPDRQFDAYTIAFGI